MKSLQEYLHGDLITEGMIFDDNFFNALSGALEPYVNQYVKDLMKAAKGPHKNEIKNFAQQVDNGWKKEYKEYLSSNHGKNDGKTIGHIWKGFTMWWRINDFDFDREDADIFNGARVFEKQIEFEYGTLNGVRMYDSNGNMFGIIIDEYKPNKNAKLEASGGTGKLNSGLFDLFNTPISVGDICICSNVKSHGALVYGKVTNVGASKVSIVSPDGEKCIAEPNNCVILQTVDGKVIDPKKVQLR